MWCYLVILRASMKLGESLLLLRIGEQLRERRRARLSVSERLALSLSLCDTQISHTIDQWEHIINLLYIRQRLTWRRFAYCAGTWPCWVLCLWKQKARMNARCSRSCCAVGGLPCSRLCWLTCALETLMCSGGVPDPDWIGGVSWKSGHLCPWGNGKYNPADVKQFSLICKAKAVRSSSDKSLKVHNCNGRLTFCGDESSSLCKYGCAGSGSNHCCEEGSGSSYSDLSGLLSSLTPCSESSLQLCPCHRHSQYLLQHTSFPSGS